MRRCRIRMMSLKEELEYQIMIVTSSVRVEASRALAAGPAGKECDARMEGRTWNDYAWTYTDVQQGLWMTGQIEPALRAA